MQRDDRTQAALKRRVRVLKRQVQILENFLVKQFPDEAEKLAERMARAEAEPRPTRNLKVKVVVK